MFPPPVARTLRGASAGPAMLLLGGCNWVVLNPAGDVARQQANMVEIATGLMLLIVVPVMALIGLFAWRYRAGNDSARYEPDWNHSTQLELVIWSAPLLIVIALGAVTWVGTHLLDPYRTIGRIGPDRPVAASARPLEVEVVALDWKWLFIYPEQQIATVNELVLPTNRPLRFRITSSSVMNSFYVPALAGQIYAMPGMETKLHAVLNRAGDSTGFSANFSGDGFSQMRFAMHGVSSADFARWAAGVHGGVHGAGAATLDHAAYLQLERPSEHEPARHFAAVSPDLFDAVVNLCVRPGKMCMSQMMALDARGGAGAAGRWNVASLLYDKFGREAETADGDLAAKSYVKTLCDAAIPQRAPLREVLAPDSLASLHGAGLPLPDTLPLVPARLTLAPAAHPLS